MMSSAFTIWRPWYTWDACCCIYLGASATAALDGTGAACIGRAGCCNYFPVIIQYMAGYITNSMRPVYTQHNYDWTVDAFA